MGYCLVSDVSSDFKDIVFSATSSITEAEVQKFIEEETAFINSMICARYQAPIDELISPNAFLVLKRICIFLTSDRVRHVLNVKTGRDASDQDSKGLHSLSRHPRADLNAIRDGKSKLGDAISVEECIGFDVGVSSTCDDSFFDSKKQQW